MVNNFNNKFKETINAPEGAISREKRKILYAVCIKFATNLNNIIYKGI